MSRKVVMEIKAIVTIVVDDGVNMDELELDMYSDNDAVDVQDFELSDTEILDSK